MGYPDPNATSTQQQMKIPSTGWMFAGQPQQQRPQPQQQPQQMKVPLTGWMFGEQRPQPPRQQSFWGGPQGFADGGEVPATENIFQRTLRRREEDAGLREAQQQPQQQGITINIGNAGDQKQEGRVPRSEAETPSLGELANSIMKLISGFENGGKVRTGSSDVKAGGEIRGPESKDGRDNQLIKVAGGEGILPKDVMDVPGVADLVQSLIQTYHTPIRK